LRSQYRAAVGAKTRIRLQKSVTGRAGPVHGRFLLYEAGIQVTFDCKTVKVCCRYSTLLRADNTMLVVSFAPEQSCSGIGVGVALACGVPVAEGLLFCVVEPLDTLHWK